MLPIGVLVPTRNAAPFVREHAAAMRPWLPQVQEVLVVDSFSQDGTVEVLKSELQHPALRFLEHPPGLYQSWNFGIKNLQAEYCYISTVGESVTGEGLAHLADVATRLRCDVVISLPQFVDVNGQPMRSLEWPIEDILRSVPVKEPIVLEGPALFFFALLNYFNAILGSSASNLYRTRCLQERPFPTDYGTAGDGGWGLTHCCRIRLGVTPQTISTFREHPKSYSKAEYAVNRLSAKMFQRISQTYREEVASNPAFASAAQELQFERILALLEAHARYQHKLEDYREMALPWSLNPLAWRVRARRNALAREVEQLKQEGLKELFPGRGR